MAALTDADVKALAETVERAAKRLGKRYDTIPPDDIAQEIWLWMLDTGADYVRRCIDTDQAHLLGKAAYHAGVRYAEKEWRASLPYDWRDQYVYSRPEVARLLPLALNPAETPGLSGTGLHDAPASRSDPAYGGGLLASIIDVRMAFDKLSANDQIFLGTCVDYDLDWPRIAVEFGTQENSAYAKYMRILDRMVTRHLGRKDD